MAVEVIPLASSTVDLARIQFATTSDFGNSLTVSNTASQHYTLAVISVVALVLTPVVLLYQGWTYYVLRARLTGEPPS